MNPTVRQIVAAIEEHFPTSWQEGFDNSGWQIELPGVNECSGVLLCVDVTPEILKEATDKGCNLIVSHHPLIFHPLKKIDSSTRVGRCVIDAVRQGICIYSSHTPCDLAPDGVSMYMAQKLGLENVAPLSGSEERGIGLGAVGTLPEPQSLGRFIEHIKSVTNSPTARIALHGSLDSPVKKIAFGGGACSDLIPRAVEAGADVFITSDVKHNLFLDYNQRITVVDLGHYETEECTKDIFYGLLTKKFPNFVPYYSTIEKNPITYL